jgi:hypothetical protein
MVLQFRAGPEAWLNAGAGEGAMQITSAMGRIRPAATFSYILGPVFFLSLAAAFLFYGQLRQRQYAVWLMAAASLSLVAATAVSGSRSVLASLAVVAFFAFISGVVLQPMQVFRWLWAGCLFAVILFATKDLQFMQEGLDSFSTPHRTGRKIRGRTAGFAELAFGDYVDIFPALYESPLLGFGLGMGTNAGAVLRTGKAQFLLAEGEWARVVLESGPVLGGAFIVWRLCLAVWLGWAAARHAMQGNPLPLLLFGVCGLSIIGGN